ncbi:hypothetical protein GDO78_011833 [Eleutherodactylus coqui]|uniref:Uncharacterized protein n=1 Tax=Eleutherodactylus coqui TaxID=57060 RepID=A0A8J6F406_ELECQ|nr:hypothetical protein GDO78_011833 [Eleutherodactylus coqui]
MPTNPSHSAVSGAILFLMFSYFGHSSDMHSLVFEFGRVGGIATSFIPQAFTTSFLLYLRIIPIRLIASSKKTTKEMLKLMESMFADITG